MSTATASTGLLGQLASASVSQIFLSFVVILSARFILRGIYRVYFHPLSKYPGPKLHAFTRIPQMIGLWKGEPHKRIEAIHAKYGRVVRTAPDEISYIDPEAWKFVHGHGDTKAQGSRPQKHWIRSGNDVTDTPSLLFAPTGAHSRMRRVFHSAFSDRSLKLQEPLIVKYIDLLRERLREKAPQGAIDIVKYFNFTTFDVMGDLAFGESLHMLNNDEYDPWVANTFEYLKTFTFLEMCQYYAVTRYGVRQLMKLMAKQRQEHFQYTVDKVNKRVDQGRATDGHDLWTLVLDKEGKREGLSRGEMFANANLFMVAGTETTATISAGFAYLMCKNPEVYAKFKKEVRETFKSQDEINIERAQALPYLNACLKEALRVYPPVSNAQPMLTPADGTTVMGEFMPPNTVVSIPQYAMYRSETNFKHALEYIPERWLGDQRFESDNRKAFEPFHVGPRDCLGKNLAWHEMRLIAAKVHHQFDFELAPESDGWTNQKIFILNQKEPLYMKLKAVY